jgi:hypothetical protein
MCQTFTPFAFLKVKSKWRGSSTNLKEVVAGDVPSTIVAPKTFWATRGVRRSTTFGIWESDAGY